MATAAFQAPPAPAPSVAAGGEQLAYTAVARVRFTTEAHAAMAARSLAVDDELQPTKAVKEFSVDGHTLVWCVAWRARARRGGAQRGHWCAAGSVDAASAPAPVALTPSHPPPAIARPARSTMRATEARVLRVMLSSFYDMAAVTLRTLRDFA